MNELAKLSERELENILLPSVYSSTHTLNWPIVHFHHLGKNVQGILPSYFDICIKPYDFKCLLKQDFS